MNDDKNIKGEKAAKDFDEEKLLKNSNSLADISIRNPVMTWMILAAILLFGGLSFDRLGVSQLPDVDLPQVSVSVTYEGASPEVIESTVIDPIENALISVEGVRSMSSTARAGRASISLEFGINKDINEVMLEINSKIFQAQRGLPAGVDTPVVSKTNPEDQPIMWLAVKAPNMKLKEMITYMRDQVQDKFLTVEGVSDIILGGYVDPALRVWLSINQLSQYSLTVQDVISTIKSESSELPVGKLDIGEKSWSVRTLGEISTASELEKLLIQRRGGTISYVPIPLGKVVKAEDDLEDVVRMIRVDGQPAMGIGIRKQRGSNAVAVAKAVKARLAEVQKSLPAGMEMAVNFDSTTYIEESVNELKFHLVLAALLTAFVCFLFFGTITSTFNVILAIPVSIMGTFFIFDQLDFTLNTFTLLGLTLAIGIVVDDAIMVLENIMRHKGMGKSRKLAARDGTKEITFAAIAATLAIVAIFLPVAFMDGIIGKYLLQFGVTISVAVLFSLFEAVTLAPMRSAQILADKTPTHFVYRGVEAGLAKLQKFYLSTLAIAIRFKWSVILLSTAMFVASLFLFPKLRKEMVPPQDQSRFMIRVTTPEGSSLQYTDGIAQKLEAIIRAMPEVKRVLISIGGWSGESTSAFGFITLQPKDTRRPVADLMEELREKSKAIKGARIIIQDPSLQSFGSRRSFPIDFNLKGPNLEVLGETANKMMEELETLGLGIDMDTNYRPESPEIHVVPNRKNANARGVSIADISETVRALIGGLAVGNVSVDGRRYDIRLRLRDEDLKHLERIKNIKIRNNRGELISLGDVADISETKSLQAIYREDRTRSIGINGNIVRGQSQQAVIDKIIEMGKSLPTGYSLSIGGSSKVFQESFGGIWFALILGLLVAYMILASQFNSYLDPVIILVALPFSFTGAIVALWGADLSVNIFSMIGILLLMGIVKKNSILLLEFANHKLAEGLSTIDSVLDAAAHRLRPILMTSFATIAAALPQAFGYGEGAETRQPMALAVVGGILLSTLMTFYVVPAFYVAFKREHKAPSNTATLTE